MDVNALRFQKATPTAAHLTVPGNHGLRKTITITGAAGRTGPPQALRGLRAPSHHLSHQLGAPERGGAATAPLLMDDREEAQERMGGTAARRDIQDHLGWATAWRGEDDTHSAKASRAAGHPVYRFRAGEDLGEERLDAPRVTARASLARAPRVQPGRYRDPPVKATVLGDQPPTWPWLRVDDHVGLDLVTGGRFCTWVGLLGLLLGSLAGLRGAFCLRRLHRASPRCTRTFKDFGVQFMDLDYGGPIPQGVSPAPQLRRGRGTGGAMLQSDFDEGVFDCIEVCRDTGNTRLGLVARHPTQWQENSLNDDDDCGLVLQGNWEDWDERELRHGLLGKTADVFRCVRPVDLMNLDATCGLIRALVYQEYEVKKKVESTRPYTNSDHPWSRAKKTGGCTVSSERREWVATNAVRESAFLKKQGKAVVERALSRQGSADKK
jgi:hypothetical protein